MKQRIMHGATIDTVTPDEIVKLLPRPAELTVVRAIETIALDANGNGTVEVYKVPLGYDFNLRRVSLDISGASDPSTGNVPLNVAGKYIAYLRSGSRIDYGVPVSVNAAPQVPGAQTWGDQQGPYLRNGEVFEVQAHGFPANSILSVAIQGQLCRPAVGESHNA